MVTARTRKIEQLALVKLGNLFGRAFRDGKMKTFPSIAVIGDIILDEFIEGDVSRISPEAPVPVFCARAGHDIAGGAANVAMNIASLGGQAVLAGRVGTDDAGARVLACLAREPMVDCSFVQLDRETVTPHKKRYRAGGQHLLRVDREAETVASQAVEDALCTFLARVGPSLRHAVISDYAKGTCSPTLIGRILPILLGQGVRLIVDTKSTDLAAFAGAAVMTPNISELMRLAQQPLRGIDDVADCARGLLRRHGIGAAVVTMAEKGMLVVTPDQEHLLPAQARRLFDVSGAGDTVVGALVVALNEGATLREAAHFANRAAGLAVEKPGTSAVRRAEMDKATSLQGAGQKVLGSAELAARVAQWRATGLRVGFTNGCFDILHEGHMALISEAAQNCDRLIVAVNADASVRRLKGPSRPVQSDRVRAIVLAGLPDVTAVTVFSEDTPAGLIAALQPDVLVKGADYAQADIIGAAETIARGGKVIRVALREGFGTSLALTRMLEEHET